MIITVNGLIERLNRYRARGLGDTAVLIVGAVPTDYDIVDGEFTKKDVSKLLISPINAVGCSKLSDEGTGENAMAIILGQDPETQKLLCNDEVERIFIAAPRDPNHKPDAHE